MNPDVGNLKKRKVFSGVAEDLGLPAPKHKCCEAVLDSECDLLSMKSLDADDVYTLTNTESVVIDAMDTQVESSQGRNCFPGESQSATAKEKVGAGLGRAGLCDVGSASWANLESGKSRNGSFCVESRITSDRGNGKEEDHCPHQDTGWNDIGCLEECFNTESHEKVGEQTAEGLEEFLASSGVHSKLLALSSESSSVDQEAQPERRKPTIDQEFEQYFSTLML